MSELGDRFLKDFMMLYNMQKGIIQDIMFIKLLFLNMSM